MGIWVPESIIALKMAPGAAWPHFRSVPERTNPCVTVPELGVDRLPEIRVDCVPAHRQVSRDIQVEKLTVPSCGFGGIQAVTGDGFCFEHEKLGCRGRSTVGVGFAGVIFEEKHWFDVHFWALVNFNST